jgi:glycosyltransferase involved in cell wall biosynthesis
LLARLDGTQAIDRVVDGLGRTPPGARIFDAHDFVWKHRRDPYDLITYQLGNASCHDFMWAYLARYPGLVVLHDPRLHHARARHLLSQRRLNDYRREFWYDHPDARRDFAEYAVEGLGGPIYYNWSMLRVVMETARMVAVHNPRVAADLRDEYPGTCVETIHLGHPASAVPDPAARERVRAALGVPAGSLLFGAFGKITAEKRIGPILRAFSAIVREQADVHLVLAGDGSDYPGLAEETASPGIGPRVHVTGYLPDEAMGDYVAATDACLCLRWPTALETSASWLHCLAAARPTVISDLAHLVDIPTVDPRDWQSSPAPGSGPVAIAIDLLDEDASLRLAMHRLATDEPLRNTLGRAGHAYWKANHTLDRMVDDYRGLFERAVERPASTPTDLPAHFTEDHSAKARTIAREFGLVIDDVLRPYSPRT